MLCLVATPNGFMKKIVNRIVIGILVFAVGSPFSLFSEDWQARSSVKIFRSIQDSGGLSEKKIGGAELGRRRDAETPTRILALLDDENYWNRIAGIYAIASRAKETSVEDSLYERMFQLYLTDHMTDRMAQMVLARYGQKFRSQWQKEIAELEAKKPMPYKDRNKIEKIQSLLALDPETTVFPVPVSPYRSADSYAKLSESPPLPKTQDLYWSILAEQDQDRKFRRAQRLGGMGKSGEIWIRHLLEDDSGSNREAGLTAWQNQNQPPDPKTTVKLFQLLIRDAYLRTRVRSTLEAKFPAVEEALWLEWKRVENDLSDSDHLLSILPRKIPPMSLARLKQIVTPIQDPPLAGRQSAYKALAERNRLENFQKEMDVFLREYVDDAQVRPIGLDYILNTGNRSDLPLFLALLERDSSLFSEKTLGIYAVKKWGNHSQEILVYEKILLSANSDPSESMVYLAMQVFADLRSESLRVELCQLTEKSRTQAVRFLAGVRLVDYDSVKNLPCLERLEKEELEPKSPATLADAFAVIVSFGIVGIAKIHQEKNRREDFAQKKKRIVEHLQHLRKKRLDGD